MQALVIDDSRVMRKLLGSLLSQLGFEVGEATDGADGLQRLAAGPLPDVVLVDWNMPNMNGLDLIRALRGRRDWDPVRVLMVSSETSPAQIGEALAAGADEYLMKPFTADSLRAKLEMLGLAAV
ncbi:response regulator [Immundisolibacter sp.]|uniref:response regulator n=1 Tax=Immundisolibacter sp. TaxID=1934948 RepID=UPI00260406E1|nr:response regulator [Immundisolibacter sp.]MDD3650115.1 response regulator [Immundisolibacter sp.]